MATAFLLHGGERIAPPVPVAEPIDIMRPREITALLARRLGQRAVARNRRRAAILAAARSLFNEAGMRGVTIRSLAARSGVAAPTIYKLVGGCGVVVEQALMEGLHAYVEHAPIVAERHQINIVSGFIETLWRATVRHPAYARHQIDLGTRTPGGRRVGTFLRQGSIATLTGWLTDLCRPEPLAMLGGAQAVAHAIEGHLRIAFMDWADGGSSLSRLRRDLATGVAIILTGLLEDGEQRRLQHWLVWLDAAERV